MNADARIDLLARLASRAAASSDAPAESASNSSILSLAAVWYGSRPSSDDATVPTGFDPIAVALFEAIVEGAFVVANADGVFDQKERHAFEQVVVAACGGQVPPAQIEALVGDLADQLREDGPERRIASLTRAVTRREHALEVLRVAALLAQVSDDVSDVERRTLEKLASSLRLEPADVDGALAAVTRALQGG